MALKFLNKKGWHTGSLRNIENVWKAEQKHDAEQKKLEELRKQIQEERERSEFRLLQEQAGLVPRQERLEFLYDSGLAVGKGNSDGFKTLDPVPSNDVASSLSGKQQESVVPGALFEEKPQSANDAWRKLHSDPLLMIRQREQEALARIKNNPVQMARIRKSVEEKKPTEKEQDRKEEKKLHHKSSKHHKHSSSRHHSEEVTPEEERKKSSSHKRSNYEDKTPTDSEDEGERGRLKRIKRHKDLKHKERSNYYDKTQQDSEDESGRERPRDRRHHKDDLKYKERTSSGLHDLKSGENDNLERIKYREKSKDDKYFPGERRNDAALRGETGNRSFSRANYSNSPANHRQPHYRRRNTAPNLTEEERAAKLREMQMDVELHEEQRRKRIRKAEENDVREAAQAGTSRGRNFLDSTQKSVYGAEKGGSSTIEESVRRRTHYLQGRSEVEGNAFRR